MMYILFNSDGSLKEKDLNEVVIQGSNNVNKIGVAIDGVDTTSFAVYGVCKLPNGETITTLPSTQVAEIKDGVNGVVLSLTEDMTALEGMLRINVQAVRLSDDKIITTYTVYLLVNEGVDPGEIVMMSVQQYQTLVALIEKDVQNDETILTFSTEPNAENYSLGQIIYVKNASVQKLYECVENESEEHKWHETFDFNDHYTKAETDDLLNEKQDELTEESLEVAQLQYAIGFDSQGNLRKGQGGGGGGATYNAGNGIDITNYTISVDIDVVATKSFVSDNYATKSSVESIEALIPAQASSSNQLADKNFVNSSIATNTANFLGTYNLVTDLGLTTSATHSEIASAIATKLASLSITPTNNDYVFVAYPDATVSSQFTQFDRYKYNSEQTAWEWEYTLNNSSFTAQQWAAINSGITSSILNQLAKQDLIAPAYDNTATYAVGAKCVYNGKLYTCSTAITTAEDFNSSHWTEISVSSGFVDLDSAQTITGIKTFSNGIKTNSVKTDGAYDSGYLINAFGNLIFYVASNNVAYVSLNAIFPASNNTKELGISSLRWSKGWFVNLDFSGVLNPNAQGYGYVLPDSTNLTGNKTLATTDYFALRSLTYDEFKNIDAPDKLALLDKGCQIIGTVGRVKNPVLFARHSYTNYHQGIAIGQIDTETGVGPFIGSWEILGQNPGVGAVINLRENNGGIVIKDSKVTGVNGKSIPAYPTTNTSPQVLNIAMGGGALSYKSITELVNKETADNTLTELSFDTISTISKSADTTFTLKTVPTGCLPEYKAYITNSHSTDTIDLTFTGVSVIKTNDSNITIASNVLTLPAGTTIEVNIQNGKMIAYNWSAN